MTVTACFADRSFQGIAVMSSYLAWLNYGCYGITAVFTGVLSQAIAAARPAPPQLDGESHSVGILYTLCTAFLSAVLLQLLSSSFTGCTLRYWDP